MQLWAIQTQPDHFTSISFSRAECIADFVNRMEQVGLGWPEVWETNRGALSQEQMNSWRKFKRGGARCVKVKVSVT